MQIKISKSPITPKETTCFHLRSTTPLTLSLVNNNIVRLKLLMVWYVMMPRTGGMVLYGDQLPCVHVHSIAAQAGCVLVLHEPTGACLESQTGQVCKRSYYT